MERIERPWSSSCLPKLDIQPEYVISILFKFGNRWDRVVKASIAGFNPQPMRRWFLCSLSRLWNRLQVNDMQFRSLVLLILLKISQTN